MHRAAGADHERLFGELAERAQRGADLDVEVGVVARVHGDDGRRGAAVGEHADEDQIGVVDPVESGVWFCVEAGGLEHGDNAGRHREVGV